MKDLTKAEAFFFPTASVKLEKKIANLLKKGLEPIKIFEKIKKTADSEQISQFLYNSSLDKTLMEFSTQQLEKGKSVSWPYLFKIFTKHNIVLDKTEKSILQSLKIRPSLSLLACEEWENIFPQIQQKRAVYIDELEKKNQSKTKDLMEKLAFAQAQQIPGEEEKIIQELLLIEPENPQYKNLQSELREKKALKAIKKQKKWQDRKRDSEQTAPFYRHPAKDPLKEDWFSALCLEAEKKAKSVKNIALFLRFCGWPDKALNVMEIHIGKMSDYWFYLEWAVEMRECAKGLELINQIFKKIDKGSADFLPLVYIKSIFLYDLGKKTEAVELMSAISHVQPDYKNVQYLLDKWTKSL